MAIHRDDIRLIVPPGHPLAELKSVKPENVTEAVLLLPRQGKTRTRLNQWLEPVADELSVSMELDSTEMMKQFVMAGLGISFLAVSNCAAELESGRLVSIPLAPEIMTRQLALIYRKDKSLSKAALGFIQVTIDHAGAVQAYRSVPAVG